MTPSGAEDGDPARHRPPRASPPAVCVPQAGGPGSAGEFLPQQHRRRPGRVSSSVRRARGGGRPRAALAGTDASMPATAALACRGIASPAGCSRWCGLAMQGARGEREPAPRPHLRVDTHTP
eukprot:scaffold1626_cov372-Prasinococcus_capsulatus_cf.AAC.13